MRRAELQLPLFDERLPFASALPIGMARGDRKFAISAPAAARKPLLTSAAVAAYEDYLRSARWAELRAEALERDEYSCRFCGAEKHLQVHHRRYPTRWGDESVRDLTTMCAACHLIFTWFRTIDSSARMRRLVRR